MNPLPNMPAHRRTLSSFEDIPVDSRSSSLNVWTQDYIQDDQIDTFNNIIAPPPAATVTERPFPRSVPITEDEEQALPRNRVQRSLTTLLPFRRTRTNSISPTRERQDNPEEQATSFTALTGDTESAKRSTGLSSWFTGSSTPMAVGIPIEEFEATYLPPPQTSTSRTPSPERAKLRKRPTMPSVSPAQSFSTTPTAKSVSTSRFSFFGAAKSPEKRRVSIPVELHDSFLTMNFTEALFPGGPTDADAFSPAAFKNLLTNAEGILTNLQTAYQARTVALHELTREKETIEEDHEEAETRSKHLKMQLREMAEKVTLHEIEMATLQAELDAERDSRRREQQEREESIKMIREHGSSPSEGRTSEDLDVEERRNLRSRMSETSFDSDAETTEGSVFSRSLSPTGTVGSTPELVQATFQAVTRISIPPTAPHPSPLSAPTARVVAFTPAKTKSVFGKLIAAGVGVGLKQEPEGCRNCQGGDTAMAWDTVGLLRAENQGLKDRVEELEESVEGALDLVRGLGMH